MRQRDDILGFARQTLPAEQRAVDVTRHYDVRAALADTLVSAASAGPSARSRWPRVGTDRGAASAVDPPWVAAAMAAAPAHPPEVQAVLDEQAQGDGPKVARNFRGAGVRGQASGHRRPRSARGGVAGAANGCTRVGAKRLRRGSAPYAGLCKEVTVLEPHPEQVDRSPPRRRDKPSGKLSCGLNVKPPLLHRRNRLSAPATTYLRGLRPAARALVRSRALPRREIRAPSFARRRIVVIASTRLPPWIRSGGGLSGSPQGWDTA